MFRPLFSALARLSLRAFGWRVEGVLPVTNKFVLIAVPHTSNWDLLLMLLVATVFGLRLSWVGKESLFRPTVGWLLRLLGGIPIIRHGARNQVEQLADQFRARERLVLAVPPEGTRGRAPHWRSGFYFIAKAARVPIALGFLDYGRRIGGVGPAVTPTDDVRADMELIRSFYAGMTGRHPRNQGPVRLEIEDDPARRT